MMGCLTAFEDSLTNLEKILTTPLPLYVLAERGAGILADHTTQGLLGTPEVSLRWIDYKTSFTVADTVH